MTTIHAQPAPLAPVASLLSLEKLAYESIKKAILSFQLIPGEALVESELGRQLGISKTPVRDAFSRLEKEGLVVKYPYKGTAVSELNQQDLREIFELRAALEGFAARQAATQRSAADLAALRDNLAHHQKAASHQNLSEAERCNRVFHKHILDCAGNLRLAGILANLEDHLHRYRTLANYQLGRMQKSVSEHELVLGALAARDAAGAERAMRQHMLSVLDDLSAHDLAELIRLAHERSSERTSILGLE